MLIDEGIGSGLQGLKLDFGWCVVLLMPHLDIVFIGLTLGRIYYCSLVRRSTTPIPEEQGRCRTKAMVRAWSNGVKPRVVPVDNCPVHPHRSQSALRSCTRVRLKDRCRGIRRKNTQRLCHLSLITKFTVMTNKTTKKKLRLSHRFRKRRRRRTSRSPRAPPSSPKGIAGRERGG